MSKRESIAAVLLILGTAALAQDAVQTAVEEARAVTQRVAPEDPVVFNGGISSEERASAPQEGTKLEFFLTSGPYLADVHVVVADAAGNELVNTVTDGPWLILDLPNGQYNVQASLNEAQVQGGMITVDERAENFGFMFSAEN
jgi:hypothetical protein